MTLIHQDFQDGTGTAALELATPPAPVTLMAWARPTALPALAPLFGWWNAAGSVATTGLAVYAQRGDFGTPGVLQGNVRVDGALWSVHGPTLVLGERVHLAISYDGITARLFVDATEVAAVPVAGTLTSFPFLNTFTANAEVEDLRVYDEALSASAISAIIAPPPPPPLPAAPVGLSDEDLAYMRETQAEHRPTAATLQNRTEVPDGMGGVTTEAGEPEPIMVRVSHAEDIPEAIAERYGAGVVTITLDLAVVTSGDQITVSPLEAYQVVSDGAVGTWTTAQQVLAVRTTWPTQGA